MGKRHGMWVGDNRVQTLLAGGPIANVIQLTPTVNQADPQDAVHEVSHLHFNIERILTTAIDECGYVIWKGKVDVGGVVPAQSLDPLSLDALAWADKDIMMQGFLPVPPVIFDVAGTPAVNRSLLHHYVEVKVKRKFGRVNHGIFMSVGCDVSSVVRVGVVNRTYLSFG